ncbi:histone-lysine N-methyltransferase SETMAR [Trichonephila clavipes]|nr:histone-lysine N-methyltransferase SETMAR [Trichonephila clavipes]
MNRQNVTKWCRHFSEGKTEFHDEQRTGRPSGISDALLQRTEEANRANRRLKLKELHQIIPHSSGGIHASGTTINAASYCQTLKRLQRAIQNKRREMLTNGVSLLHNNAWPHTALVTKALHKQFKWEVLDHPPYSPGVALSDFHLFRYLKLHLGGKLFHG